MLEKRDYTGAITLLRFQKNTSKIDPLANQWLAYAAFHNGDFEVARKVSQSFMFSPSHILSTIIVRDII